MNAHGINRGKSGNVSARLSGAGFDGFVVTPTGLAYEDTRPEDVVPMTLDGDARGSRLPSSEWRFHRDIYRARPEVNAVVHTHAPFATTLACLSRGIPAFHYMVAVAGGRDIRCAPYATFGTQELSDRALAALDGRKACLLAHHGMIAVGASLSDCARARGRSGDARRDLLARALDRGARGAGRRRDGRRAREVQDLRTGTACRGLARISPCPWRNCASFRSNRTTRMTAPADDAASPRRSLALARDAEAAGDLTAALGALSCGRAR